MRHHATLALVLGLISIAIFGANSASLSDISPVLQKYVLKCSEKTGATMEQIGEAFTKRGTLRKASHEVLCFVTCFLEEGGALDGKKMNSDKMYELMKEGDEAVTDACKKEMESSGVEVDECEDVLKIDICWSGA